jgi:uncharacterized RDD family membrane protein YckC
MGEWYYARGSEQLGPVTTDDLKVRLSRGEVAAGDLVWTAGMANWEPAQNRPELFNAAMLGNAPGVQPLNYGGYAPTYTNVRHLEYGGFWLRFVAWFIDCLVVNAGSFIISFVAGACIGALMATNGAPLPQIRAVGGMVGFTLGIIIWWLYYAMMESSAKQATLGKMALGLRVTDLDGGRISFGRASGRLFAKMLSGIIFLIGYMMAGWTARKQALHDLLANTLVVRR